MNLYLLPVQRVLLEYVIKLGEVIFFAGSTSDNDIDNSSLNIDEKLILRKILLENKKFFEKTIQFSYILYFSKYEAKEINDDPNILESILVESDRSLDYIRILECPFAKPEYFIGIPGLVDDTRYLFSIDDHYKIGFYIEGEKYYYSMQKGIGLDIGSRESNDTLLYQTLFSKRDDEVYYKYRNLMSEACNALKIADEGRCFVYLFSKVDGMGLCDTYRFQMNKIRILSVVANNQHEFDLLSNRLFFYSKSIRTEVVHKGRRIDELVSLDEAKKMNQQLFNIIIEFCCSVISTNIFKITDLKAFMDMTTGKFEYKKPEIESIVSLPALVYPLTTYVAFAEGLEVDIPQKRGNFIILPKISEYGGVSRYYKNYVAKDLGGLYDEEFEDFSIDDFEYILEILYRLHNREEDIPIIIGLRLPRMMNNYMSSVKLRESVVDYICNLLNAALYYDMLSGGCFLNGDILPPRIGLKEGIRLIYEFVEYKEELELQGIPGRVFGNYLIPKSEYKCVNTYKDEIYSILYNPSNYIVTIYREALISVCESEYLYDLTIKISYLFDIFDGLDPRTYNGDKVVKLVFAFVSTDKENYFAQKQKYESIRQKYRNPILHAGKNVFEIENNKTEIRKVELYLKNLIIDFCLKICSMEITNWDKLDSEQKKQQMRLGLL